MTSTKIERNNLGGGVNRSKQQEIEREVQKIIKSSYPKIGVWIPEMEEAKKNAAPKDYAKAESLKSKIYSQIQTLEKKSLTPKTKLEIQNSFLNNHKELVSLEKKIDDAYWATKSSFSWGEKRDLQGEMMLPYKPFGKANLVDSLLKEKHEASAGEQDPVIDPKLEKEYLEGK